MAWARRIIAAALFGVLFTPGSAHAQHTWTPLTLLSQETDLPLQSEPAVMTAASQSIVVWMDGRQMQPDIYAARVNGTSISSEIRLTNRTPHLQAWRAHNPAVALEPSGRAFIAWTDNARTILLTRLDASASLSASAPFSTVVVNATGTWDGAHQPQIVSDGNGNLVIAWTGYTTSSPTHADVFVARCDGNVMTCNAHQLVHTDTTPPAHQRRPRLSRFGSQVVAVWEDTRELGMNYPRIYAAFSSDGGASWNLPLRVNKDLSGVISSTARIAATYPVVTHAPDGTIYVAWAHHNGSVTAEADIYVARWTGTDWSTPWRVDAAPRRRNSTAPTIAANISGVFVAWHDYRNGLNNPDIYAARWNGTAWQEIPASIHAGKQMYPALSAEPSGAPVLTWQDSRNGQDDVYLSRWNGSGWDAPVQVNNNTNTLSYQMFPQLIVQGGTVRAFAHDQRTGQPELWFTTMTSTLPAWSALQGVPVMEREDSLRYEPFGVAATADGKAHLVWVDYVWPHGQRARYAYYDGNTWSPPLRLSRVFTNAERAPRIAAFDNALAAAWGRNLYSPTRFELYASWNTGSGWVTETAVLTQPMVNVWFSPFDVAIDATQVYVAWQQRDDSTGRHAIWLASRALTPGASWSYQEVSVPSGTDWCGQTRPRLRVSPNGRLHLMWTGCARRNPSNMWPVDSYAMYRYSDDGGTTWSTPLRVSLVSPNNNTSSVTAFNTNSDGSEVMALYPAQVSTNQWEFVAALIRNGSVVFTQTLTSGSNWATSMSFLNRWYDGDSGGDVVFVPTTQRYVLAFPDRSNGRAPRILTTSYGDLSFIPRAFVPIVQR